MRHLLFFVCAFSCLIATNSLSAQSIVYNNGAGGASGVDDAYASDAEVAIFGVDDFTLSGTATLTSVSWTGVYAFLNTAPAADDFTVNIYDDSGSGPGSLLASWAVGDAVGRVDSGVDDPILGFDIYEYQASISGFTAQAGTNYFLEVHGNTVGEDDDWLWAIVNGAGDSYGSADGGATYSPEGHQMDFELSGITVPEPTGMFALLGGTIGLVLRRRR